MAHNTMQTTQHTIQAPVKISGVGIHTGHLINLTCLPAAPNHGIQFQRIDLSNQPTIAALADYVVDTTRSTTLGNDEMRIGTIEHLLAALVGLEIDNMLIQLDGPEVPMLDGSAAPFVQALQQVGVVDQGVTRRFLQITESIIYQDETHEVSAFPLDDYRLAVMIHYDHPALQNQHASLNQLQEFIYEIAPCRSFAFLHEIKALYNQGLIKGGSLDNALVFVKEKLSTNEIHHLSKLFNQPSFQANDTGTLNNVTLRFNNEPARHKLLDLMGDLALIGCPIKGQIIAQKPGHAVNVAFAKKLRKLMLQQAHLAIPHYDPSIEPVFNIKQITQLLPHRYPFQLVDKIIQLNGRTVTGIKNVTINEPFFQGHFPDNPVMPGVLQIEALVQTGGVLVLNGVPDPENYSTYFLAIEQCRFRKMVLPGDTLVMRCELLADVKRGIAKMKGMGFVGSTLACEAIMTAQIVKRKV
jgi:UDP-3-O-[3-hydroxymyristoyl] N-acetylglucosamine deacetylase/3-hydroxyacyl-[acyl-carrier-protein] dehydratase